MPNHGEKRRRVQRVHWCFTSFCSPDQIQQNLQSALADERFIYCICQLESSPTTGRAHVQGYIELGRSQDLKWVQQLLGDDAAHLEPRRGSREQAREYCRKEETRVRDAESGPWEFGVWKESKQGERNDLNSVAESILSGDRVDDIAVQNPVAFIRYHRGISELARVRDRQRLMGLSRQVKVQVFWGKSGLGKTRRAKYENPNAYYLDIQRGSSMVWFDGYDGHETLIIDEFLGNLPYQYLLKLTDPHPVLDKLPVKGGYVAAAFSKVVITSNSHPHAWYRDEVHPNQTYIESPLWRRVEKEGELIEFLEEWTPDQ